MLHAFDFDIDDDSFLLSDYLYNQDLDPVLKLKEPVSKIINTTMKRNGDSLIEEIDYNVFIENWFPSTNAHIFISHSHQDKEKAVSLANFLYKEFGIYSFIDSEVWGYLDDALLPLNKKFNQIDEDDNLFSYEGCNKLSASLNLILTSALTKMINSADSLIFINTIKSNYFGEGDGFKTHSPWIFTEILLSSMLMKNPHSDRPNKDNVIKSHWSFAMESLSGIERREVGFTFPLGMEHMCKVTVDKLENIKNMKRNLTSTDNPILTLNGSNIHFSNEDIFKNLDEIYGISFKR